MLNVNNTSVEDAAAAPKTAKQKALAFASHKYECRACVFIPNIRAQPERLRAS